VPKFQFNQDTPLSAATGDFNRSIPTRFLVAPANFSFPAYAELQVDTGSNFIPLKFTHLNALIFDLQTNVEVGTGDLYGVTVPAKRFTKIQVPMNFSYVADNSSDITCKPFSVAFAPPFECGGIDTWALLGANWYNSCRNAALFPTGERPGTSPCRLPLQDIVFNSSIPRVTYRAPLQACAGDANCRVDWKSIHVDTGYGRKLPNPTSNERCLSDSDTPLSPIPLSVSLTLPYTPLIVVISSTLLAGHVVIVTLHTSRTFPQYPPPSLHTCLSDTQTYLFMTYPLPTFILSSHTVAYLLLLHHPGRLCTQIRLLTDVFCHNRISPFFFRTGYA